MKFRNYLISMKAVILAGGMGTRLRPIIGNDNLKVMLKYSDKPLLYRTVELLRDHGIKEIIFVVSHMKHKIIEYFGDGKNFGVKIDYAFQENPKGGTADAVMAAKNKINEDNFILLYGDNVFDESSIEKLLNSRFGFDGVLCTKEVENPSKFGILEVNGTFVKKIHEKPEVPPTNLAMTGLFILPKEIFSATEKTKLSPRGEYELTDSIQILIDSGMKIGYCKLSGFWLDPRDKNEIEQAKKLISKTN